MTTLIRSFTLFRQPSTLSKSGRRFVICLDFDSYAYEAIAAEDPGFVRDVFKPYVDSGRIDIVGGTYSQPYPEIIGWESNVRQFVEGRAVISKLLGKRVDCFLTEEIAFHPQMPQLLKLYGYSSASLECQNSGEIRKINKSVVAWRGLDGTEIPTIPSNDLMISLTQQYKPFDDVISRSAAYQEPLMTLWAEIWAPGGDWGASYLPYEKGFQSFEKAGSDRVQERRYHAAIPALIGGAALLFIAKTANPAAAIALLSLMGIGIEGFFGPFWSLPGEYLTGIGAASGIALINSVGNLGGFAGPYLLGVVARQSGSAQSGFVFVGVAMLAGGLLLLGLMRVRGNDAAGRSRNLPKRKVTAEGSSDRPSAN